MRRYARGGSPYRSAAREVPGSPGKSRIATAEGAAVGHLVATLRHRSYVGDFVDSPANVFDEQDLGYETFGPPLSASCSKDVNAFVYVSIRQCRMEIPEQRAAAEGSGRGCYCSACALGPEATEEGGNSEWRANA